jgi:hypothetical protein
MPIANAQGTTNRLIAKPPGSGNDIPDMAADYGRAEVAVITKG